MGQKSTQVRNDENGVKIEFIEILTQAQPIYINLDLLCECLISFFSFSFYFDFRLTVPFAIRIVQSCQINASYS